MKRPAIIGIAVVLLTAAALTVAHHHAFRKAPKPCGCLVNSFAPQRFELTTLYHFTGGDDGDHPLFGLVLGTDGNFYGTTQSYGENHYGTIFRITTSGDLTTVFQFTGIPDGDCPSRLVRDNDGCYYGTTFLGGSQDSGTVFKITPSGERSTLYTFPGPSEGRPASGLVTGADGNLYGTTSTGAHKAGTVFRITPSGNLTTLYAFTGDKDGSTPGDLVQGSDGCLYGGTRRGGAKNMGTIFKITPLGILTTLHSFKGGSEGSGWISRMIQAADGVFYGTTTEGGPSNKGTVFKITMSGNLTTLHSFTGGNDGSTPYGLVLGRDGTIYGSTFDGGRSGYRRSGYGTIFKIMPTGALSTQYSFSGDDGHYPAGGLVQGIDGCYYGITLGNNKKDKGTVFRFSPAP